jgi:RimJ/RimL family protein N-acetyltransferase
MHLSERARAQVVAMWERWAAQEFADDFPGVSIVEVCGRRFVRAPEHARARLGDDPPFDLDELVDRLGDCVDSVVGIARLAYGDDSSLRLAETGPLTEIADDDPRLAALEDASDRFEWLEASADEPCAARLGVVEAGAVVAVATLQAWGDTVAHFGVFTRADARGRGLAARTASGVITMARARDLVPQWRSRFGNEASAAVADRLGFIASGQQLFVRVRPPGR